MTEEHPYPVAVEMRYLLNSTKLRRWQWRIKWSDGEYHGDGRALFPWTALWVANRVLHRFCVRADPKWVLLDVSPITQRQRAREH